MASLPGRNDYRWPTSDAPRPAVGRARLATFLNALAAITSKDYAEEALSVVHSLNFRSALPKEDSNLMQPSTNPLNVVYIFEISRESD